MAKALEAVRAGLTIRRASIEFEAPRSTLADRGDTPLKPNGRLGDETGPTRLWY